jgi:hypothetical protein
LVKSFASVRNGDPDRQCSMHRVHLMVSCHFAAGRAPISAISEVPLLDKETYDFKGFDDFLAPAETFFFFLKANTTAGFDPTTHSSASRDDTIRPRYQGAPPEVNVMITVYCRRFGLFFCKNIVFLLNRFKA